MYPIEHISVQRLMQRYKNNVHVCYYSAFTVEFKQVLSIWMQIPSVNSFQSSVTFLKETSHSNLQSKANDWFLHETQQWAGMG